MLPLIRRHVACEPIREVQRAIVDTHCPTMRRGLGGLSTGYLLSALGLTLAAFWVCACWRKLVKVSEANKIAPGAPAEDGKKSENGAMLAEI